MAEQPRARWSLLADLRPLRESPAFRRLWIGTSVSSVGSAMTGFAVVLLGIPVALFPALNAARFGGSPQTLGLHPNSGARRPDPG
jgi:hypothetical protein